jgi:hypothetical protein
LDKIKHLLVQFCLTKHNGFISRLVVGSVDQVVQHVGRAVDSGIVNVDFNFKGYCAVMRQKREQGQYSQVIRLEGLLGEKGEEQCTPSPLPLGFKCTVSGTNPKTVNSEKPLLDNPLPPTIETKLMDIATAKHPDKNGRLIATMRKHNGEYPFVTFARRFLNEIWRQGGEGNIHYTHLQRMLGLKPGDENRSMVIKYKNLLRKHGIIKGGWQKFIRRGVYSSRYSLTNRVRQEFEKSRGREAVAG